MLNLLSSSFERTILFYVYLRNLNVKSLSVVNLSFSILFFGYYYSFIISARKLRKVKFVAMRPGPYFVPTLCSEIIFCLNDGCLNDVKFSIDK